MDTSEEFFLLKEYCNQFQIAVSDESLCKCLQHTHLVLEKNILVNLTSIKSMEDALILHVLDSLLFVKILTSQEALRASKNKVLDLGTGGGYPGIPIASCGFEETTLLDSVGKKVKACQEFCDELLLDNVHCVHARFEEYALKEPQSFDYVVARAVAQLDVLLEYAEPFVKQKGYVVLGKANPTDEEITNAKITSKICGYKFVSRETFDLPENFGHRELYIYKKVSQSRVKLPRRNGEAKKNPLSSK